MKKGQAIKEVVQRINDDVQYKKDYIITQNALQINTNTSGSVYPNIQLTDSPREWNMTDHSLNQLCGRLEIGTRYIQKLLPVSQYMVAHNLNFWIRNNQSRDLMFRAFEKDAHGTCRAIMTNRYKRLDSDVVANHSLNKLMDMGAELKYSHYDRDSLNITAVLPKLEGEVEEGDVVQGGITITNNEIGGGSLLIQPFIYRLVCTNGMVAPRYLNRFYAKHVGKIVIDPSNDEQWVSIINKMQKQIELISNPELFQENLQKLKEATAEKVTSHKIREITRYHGLSDFERKQIFERLDHYVSDTFSTSKYQLANAITNIANDEDKSDQRARFLQELGGLIIFANNPMGLKISA
jgi:hypothetical protein